MDMQLPSSKATAKICRLFFKSILVLLIGFSLNTSVFAAAGPGGIVQGVIGYPDFLNSPQGTIEDLDSPFQDFYSPYTNILLSPFPIVDDSVHTPGVPGVRVYLKNLVSGGTTTAIVTDSNGVFVFPHKPAGSWAVCWLSLPGTGPGCTDTSLFNTNTFTVIDHASSRWASNLGGTSGIDWSPLDNPANNILAFEGYVQAPGLPIPYQPNMNTACVHNDPFFGFDQTATVQLLDSNQVILATVKANRLGRYLLAINAPSVATDFTLKASCGSNVSTPVSVSASGPARLYQDLLLPFNAPPSITSLVAKSNNVNVSGVPLGGTVTAIVSAVDSDANPLLYRWKATAGTVTPHGRSATWVLPASGKGLHFLYVDVTDNRGGHDTKRAIISTDTGIVAASATLVSPPKQPADFYTEANRFLTYRGIDTKISACQYYRAIGAVTQCSADGTLIGSITFDQWLAKYGLSKPPSPYTANPTLKPGELHAQFRNVADLNLIRNHRGRNAGNDVNGKSQVAYYVCNHAKATGATPDVNLVACVSMEYSVSPGQNGGNPFTKFLTFGPTGDLIASVNLDGRGEKFTPGNCVPCHGGDNYYYHFPEKGAGPLDGNIGSYFIPFDLDNFDFEAPYTRAAQENAVRGLNRGLKVGQMLTSAAKELIEGWYPTGTALAQNDSFLPKGWDPAKTASVPVAGQLDSNGNPYMFNGADLYLKVIKPSCRGCHLAMGTPLGLDFHSYEYDGTPGDFVHGNALIPRTGNNLSHAGHTICDKFHDGLPTYNFFEDLNSPARTMPNAIETFNRFWNSPTQINLMEMALRSLGVNDQCTVPGL